MSWQATQDAATGEVTSVVPCASQGAAAEQVATIPVQGCDVVQVHGTDSVQAVVVVPTLCVKDTGTLLTVNGPEMVTLHGFAAVRLRAPLDKRAAAPTAPRVPGAPRAGSARGIGPTRRPARV